MTGVQATAARSDSAGSGDPVDPAHAGASAGSAWANSAWAVTAAFGAYFCMYGFRKPFTAASYAGAGAFGLDLKTTLVIAQVFGYMVSKFVGIKVISEMAPGRRVAALLGLVGTAELALAAMAFDHPSRAPLWLFANGLPLGMVYGLVVAFLEGRKQTEALTAGLCASFIVADGVTKAVGAGLLGAGVGEAQMPAVAGLVYAGPMLLFAWMLSRIVPPSAADVAARSERAPMTGADRMALVRRYLPGLVLLGVAFLLVTVLRSVRADFQPQIYAGLGVTVPAATFANTEIVVGLAILLPTALMALIRDNRTAFFAALGVSLLGAALVLVSLAGLRGGWLGPVPFMTLVGVGLYLPYVVFHTAVFERLIAMTREKGTMAFLMYVVDSFGYLGYVGYLVATKLAAPQGGILGFFLAACLVTAIGVMATLLPCFAYFARHPRVR